VDVAFEHAADFALLEPKGPRPSELVEINRAKVDFIWHDILHAVAAIDRGRPLRALFYIERLRHGAIEPSPRPGSGSMRATTSRRTSCPAIFAIC
jgi:hypothetical protein